MVTPPLRLDAHQHFWVYDEFEHDWMTEGMETLQRDHLPGELLPQLLAAGYAGCVAVQARRMLRESDWLLSLADEHPFVHGVVGWADTASPDLEAELERLAANPRFVGLRELIHDMPDPDYALSAPHLRLVEAAGRHGLCYDLLVRPEHLPAAVRLVDLFPGQAFVVDHIAKPGMGRTSGGWPQSAHEVGGSAWADGMRALAERPHVNCKISGLLTECGPTWHSEQVAPFLDLVLEAFGPERCMVGSDWPVCTLAASYGTTMGLIEGHLHRLSATEQDELLGGTCARFYRLETPRLQPPRRDPP